MHSYTGPSGRRYHLDAEGARDGGVHLTADCGSEVAIPMRDILWLAALQKRSEMTNRAEMASDLDILGMDHDEGEGRK